MGAQIEGEGTSTITIEGVDRLGGATHRVVTDRIELGTYMLAPAICGGEVDLPRRLASTLVGAFCERLDAAGIAVEETDRGLKVTRGERPHPRGRRHDRALPGLSDRPAGADDGAALHRRGHSRCWNETIFENRFMHAPELMRMGAKIDVHGGTATVAGVERLRGAPVMATDLRASVSLILAGLAAEGETIVSRVYHLDRGYEQVEEKLRAWAQRSRRVKGE